MNVSGPDSSTAPLPTARAEDRGGGAKAFGVDDGAAGGPGCCIGIRAICIGCIGCCIGIGCWIGIGIGADCIGLACIGRFVGCAGGCIGFVGTTPYICCMPIGCGACIDGGNGN